MEGVRHENNPHGAHEVHVSPHVKDARDLDRHSGYVHPRTRPVRLPRVPCVDNGDGYHEEPTKTAHLRDRTSAPRFHVLGYLLLPTKVVRAAAPRRYCGDARHREHARLELGHRARESAAGLVQRVLGHHEERRGREEGRQHRPGGVPERRRLPRPLLFGIGLVG